MDKTNPSEAAAASSPYLSEGMLRAQANPDCAFPDAVQVLSREVLRLRAQCPPTAEVEKLRAGASEARLRKESKRDQVGKQQALLDEIARLVPGKGTLTERVARLANFYRDAHDADMDRYGFAQLRLIGEDIGAFYDPGIGTRKSVAKLLRAYSDKAYQVERLQFECEARTGRSTCPATGGVVGASDFLKAMRTTEPKPEVARKPVRDLVDEALRMVRGKMREAPNFAFDPAEPLGSKVAPATGQPRTEVPLAADGSGTLFADLVKAGKAIYLGEVFYKALEHADPDFFGSPQFLDGKTDEESRYRHLYCAVRELAKVVERIGAR